MVLWVLLFPPPPDGALFRDDMKKLRLLVASAHSASLAIFAVTIVTIGGELSESFKEWLKGFTGHHWITKSYFLLLVFIIGNLIFYFANRTPNLMSARRALIALMTIAILGSLALFFFFTWHFLNG